MDSPTNTQETALRALNIVDCHTHLQNYEESQKDAIIKESIANGIKYFICNSTSDKDFQLVAELYKKYQDNLVPCFGVHPWYSTDLREDWKQQFKTLHEAHPQGVVGEIGLDWQQSIPKDFQTRIFEEQFAYAAEINRPCSIHCVEAHDTMLEVMKKFIKSKSDGKATEEDKRMNVHLHSYSGSEDMTRQLLDLDANVYFSFSLWSLKKEGIYEKIPLDRLVVETDSPFQYYEPIMKEFGVQDTTKRGKICNRNFKPEQWTEHNYCESAHLRYFVQKLATIFDKNVSEVGETLYQNSLRCFRINKP